MPQYPAILDLSALDGTNGFQIDGGAGNYSGFSVASAGDVNGDGFDDVIIGAPHANTLTGAAYVVFGSGSGFGPALDVSSLDGNNGFRIGGAASYSFGGLSVASAGDVNGDGIDDFVVGAPFAGAQAGGASYVVFGNASGFASTFDVSTLDGNNGFQIGSTITNGGNGYSVASAGDVNGDGIGDLIVGGPGGASCVVFGSGTGFGASLDVSALDGNNGFRLTGESYLGISVSSAGDINGDGFDDVMVSVAAYYGTVCVVYGKASGFGSAFDVTSLDGNNGFSIQTSVNDMTGRSISSAGDVNGDGRPDLIIGTEDGAYVVFGRASGFGATVELSSLNSNDGFVIVDETGTEDAGRSVASAGDVNGDGFDDLLVGARYADPHGANSGDAYVVFGKATGFGAVVDLASLNGEDGFRIDGETAGEQSGFSVAAAGDVNGDGLSDLIVGAPYAGASYVIFASLPDEAVARNGTAVANTIHGSNFDDTLVGLGGNDTLIGHDGDDTILGGAGNDTIDAGMGDDFVVGGNDEDVIVGDLGADTAYGGSGHDVLYGGIGNDRLFGGSEKDSLRAGNGINVIDGGASRDLLVGGHNQDTFVFDAVSDSTGGFRDTVKGADFAIDRFDTPRGVTGIDATIATGTLNGGAAFDAGLASAVDAAHLGAHHAVFFTPDAGAFAASTFLIVDTNGVAGYQAGADIVVQLNLSANLASIDVDNFV